MSQQEYPLMDIPNPEECESLLRSPQLLLNRYLDCVGLLNHLLDERHALQTNLDALHDISQLSEAEISNLKNRIAVLEDENLRLLQQLNNSSSVGRPPKYDADTRQCVIDFYNESTSHTYNVTAEHFNMSTNTLSNILKTARDNGIHVRSRRQ